MGKILLRRVARHQIHLIGRGWRTELNPIVRPASVRAASTALRKAHSTDTVIFMAGSPVAFDRSTPVALELFCRKRTRKSTGMSFAPGGLYVQVRFVSSAPDCGS
uniref:Uncharacterized protein n=1 Tax=Anopheles merus TaxID=30066 RepID=A0A182UZU6_ANOME